VATYHQLADRLAKKNGVVMEYTLDKPFVQMENFMNSFVPASTDLYDDLIIDEGQDMNQVWANNLMKMLKPDGCAWWLEDPMQNLYGREPVKLPNWVTIHSQSNYRTPRNILRELNSILGLEKPIESISPIEGHSVDVIFYSENESLVEKTIQAIDMAITMGFKAQNIAILSYRGRENSALAPYTQLGEYTLHAPQSKYDQFGNLIYSEGEIEIDSVHRFKGRASACVILTEIDFNALDDNAQKRIFVGATRATMRLIMVMSRKSKDVMLSYIS
jgi:superfamily I DNA/RNA helicase